jgi:hypothetical protein
LPIQDFADWVLMFTLADTIAQHSILLTKPLAAITIHWHVQISSEAEFVSFIWSIQHANITTFVGCKIW